MNPVDEIYGDLIQNILNNGETVKTRNSVCKRIHSVAASFTQTPLVGVRKTAWKNALREWEWFMSGSNRIKDLHPNVHSWWKPWADNKYGMVPFNYSVQFRDYRGGYNKVDQIQLLVDGIINHPYSRRNVITTWNTADMVNPICPITNCHGTIIQAFVSTEGYLDITTYQRSADVVCGLPHNWVQYWAFLLWLATRTDKRVGTLTWFGGDVHIYDAHIPLAERIAAQRYSTLPTPDMHYYITGSSPDWEFKAEDFGLRGDYLPLIHEKAEMVV